MRAQKNKLSKEQILVARAVHFNQHSLAYDPEVVIRNTVGCLFTYLASSLVAENGIEPFNEPL